MSYRLAPKRLLLGFLIADPRVEEPLLATTLYTGAVTLAREAGIGEVRARANPYDNYPREVGCHRWRGAWRSDTVLPFEVRGELPVGGWRRIFALLGIVAVLLFRAFRDYEDHRARGSREGAGL